MCLLAVISMPCLPALAAATNTSTTLSITKGSVAASEVVSGTVLTLTATVKAGTSAVTLGQVNFCVASSTVCADIHDVGEAQLSSGGKAVVKLVPPVGVHKYKAVFVGTQSNGASSSAAESVTVDGITKTSIAQSGSVGDYSLKATVVASGSNTAPTGDVSFRDTSNDDTVLGTATLGKATETVTWTNTQNPATKPQPFSIAVADFNGDGVPDLAIGTTGTTEGYLSILLGNGDGTFQTAKSFAALPNNQALAVAAFVDGGPQDVLTVSSTTSGTNAVLFIGDGKGGGQVSKPFNLGLTNVTAVAAADFNRDGSQDVVITGAIYGIYCFAPLLGNGDGTFGSPTLNAVGNNPLALAVGDFTGKGFLDVAVADSGADTVTMFLNDGQSDFAPTGASMDVGSHPIGMVTGDFNGDGKLDLAVVNEDSDNVSILLGKGDGTFGAATGLATGHKPVSIAVGDFNDDGLADLAVLNSADRTVSILLGNGRGAFTLSGTHATGIDPSALVVGSFTAAGAASFVVANQDIGKTTGSTLTVEASELVQTASATKTAISPAGTGAHLVAAEYEGDSLYETSVSGTTSLKGQSGAAVGVMPNSVSFPATTVGSTAAGQVVTLKNTGSSALAISGITLAGGQADDFGLSKTCGSSLAAGASCTVTVTFKPVSAGTKSASISIADNASGSPQSVALTGIGTASSTPSATLSKTSLTFPSQAAGTTSASQSVTLTNSGSGALTLSSITLTGGQADDFTLSKSCGSSLAAGAKCTLTVTFKPVSAGKKSARVSIADNASGSPQSVALTGTGTAAQ